MKEAALPFLVIKDADKTLAKLRGDGIETTAEEPKAPII